MVVGVFAVAFLFNICFSGGFKREKHRVWCLAVGLVGWSGRLGLTWGWWLVYFYLTRAGWLSMPVLSIEMGDIHEWDGGHWA